MNYWDSNMIRQVLPCRYEFAKHNYPSWRMFDTATMS